MCSPSRFFAKVPVFPFMKFPGIDRCSGPDGTGEVMGIGETEALALAGPTSRQNAAAQEERIPEPQRSRQTGAGRDCARAGWAGVRMATEGTNRLLGGQELSRGSAR